LSSLFSDNQWTQVASKDQLEKVVDIMSEYYGMTSLKADKRNVKSCDMSPLKPRKEENEADNIVDDVS